MYFCIFLFIVDVLIVFIINEHDERIIFAFTREYFCVLFLIKIVYRYLY